ncbi:DUF4097 family beta strand repeat-containing protein [Paraclostridium ghonii]|uniref:DUF4097 family beta strand repeat-containing protein n=1 Tax=Paraclostridium ghonii TaxID=29358 RepID=UPI00202CF4E6|nr:DUF4097 family beta strand repeat-containing protein [Paeniclostridium ghonii]MCM0166907.1 DUF4097 domain-containing protein [Paeniclostridium ghonii]
MDDKKLLKLKMLTWSIVAIMLSLFLVFNISGYEGNLFNYNFNSFGFNRISNLKVVKEYKFDNAKELKNISTNISNGDVTFNKNNEDNIKVIVKSNKDLKNKNYISASQEADTLNVVDSGTRGKFNIFGVIKDPYMKVEVLLPQSYDGNLNISNNVGDIEFLSDLKFDNINLKVKTGDIDINNKLTANKVVIDSKTGDLYVNTLIAKDSSIDNKTGDIEIEEFQGKGNIDAKVGDIYCGIETLDGNLKVRSEVGDIDLFLNENLNFKLDVNKGFGDIDTGLEFNNVSQTSKSFSGSFGKESGNLISVDIKTGDIEINAK